jgi:hypothetical protein
MDLSDTLVEQLVELRLQGIPVYRIPDVCEILWYQLPLSLLQNNWLAFGGGFNLTSGSVSLKLNTLVPTLCVTWAKQAMT